MTLVLLKVIPSSIFNREKRIYTGHLVPLNLLRSYPWTGFCELTRVTRGKLKIM